MSYPKIPIYVQVPPVVSSPLHANCPYLLSDNPNKMQNVLVFYPTPLIPILHTNPIKITCTEWAQV